MLGAPIAWMATLALVGSPSFADHGDVKNSTIEMENCSELLYPPMLEINLLLADIRALLSADSKLGAIELSAELGVPFLRRFKDLLKNRNPQLLQALENSLAQDPGVTGPARGKIVDYINRFVYPVWKTRVFSTDLNENNYEIFVSGFDRAIQDGVNSFSDSRKRFDNDLLIWFRSKKDELTKTVSQYKTSSSSVQRTEDTRWAKRVHKTVREHLKTDELFTDDEIALLAEIAKWHPKLEKKYIEVVDKPNLTKWQRVAALVRPSPAGKPRRVLVPNVTLPANDPLWLFNRVSPASNNNYAGDQIYTNFDHFQSLAEFGEIPDFTSDHRWWMKSDGFADITGKTSRGLPTEFRGENFRRKMFWPKAFLWGAPLVNEMRVAVTETADGKPLTLEVLAGSDEIHWNAFYFHREGNLWVRDTHIGGRPVEEKCLECHASDGTGIVPYGKLSPRPFFLKEEKHFLAVGYKDLKLIQQFLRF